MSPQHTILVVDDDEQNRELLLAMLGSLGHLTEIARDGIEALAKIALDVDLVLLDAMMPGMDGFEVARRIRETANGGDLPIIMVTALRSKADRLRAVEAGINDFIAKPVEATELRLRTSSLLRMKEAQDAIKRHRAALEETVDKRTSELRAALEHMAEAQRRTHHAYLDTIQRLAVVTEYRDKETERHIQRMGEYSALLARRLGLTPAQVEVIRVASPMHDVGKIGIPDAILLKPGKLENEEWEIMKTHAAIGGQILGGSDSELLEAGKLIALSHHEKWNGSGYPRGLSGENIALTGRICAVADVFDALTSERPYKRASTEEEALAIMREGRGKHFDPALIDLFLADIDEVGAIKNQHGS